MLHWVTWFSGMLVVDGWIRWSRWSFQPLWFYEKVSFSYFSLMCFASSACLSFRSANSPCLPMLTWLYSFCTVEECASHERYSFTLGAESFPQTALIYSLPISEVYPIWLFSKTFYFTPLASLTCFIWLSLLQMVKLFEESHKGWILYFVKQKL